MKISYSWLQEFVDVPYTPEVLADKLTLLGLEVASLTPIGKNLSNVVVGEVIDLKPHPQADKLKVCTVAAGAKKYNVVCGAPNVAVGQRVPLALEGCVLPDGMEIKKTEIRGVGSQGMICSQKELGLGDDAAGIMVLGESFEPGTDFNSAKGITDCIFEIELTPNRPDCLSMTGIAREVSILTGNVLRYPVYSKPEVLEKQDDNISITIKDPSLCENYSAYIIRGINVSPSPFWLANKIEKLGMRSINTVVDVTNFVLLEMGHPLHAFDLNKLKGPQIIVRRALQCEKIITLDSKERILDKSMLVIADSDDPVAVAGVMGGASSEVSVETTDILLEGAYFNPVSIRKTAKSLGLSTEASHRFERGTDRVGFQKALQRAAYLIAELCGASSISPLIENNALPAEEKFIVCNTKKISSLIGVELSHDEIVAFIEKLGIDIVQRNHENLKLSIPSYRVDIAIEEDIVEEIARLYGYDKIPMARPGSTYVECEVNKKLIYSRFTRDVLVGAGFYETLTCSLVSESVNKRIPCWLSEPNMPPVCVQNPISEMQKALQASLIPNLLDVVAVNVKHKAEAVKLFELGNIFVPVSPMQAHEKYMLCIAVAGNIEPASWHGSAELWDFYKFKGFLVGYLDILDIKSYMLDRVTLEYLHPGRSAKLYDGDTFIGIFGQIHPSVAIDLGVPENTFIAELDAQFLIDKMNLRGAYSPLPKYPAVERDLAIVVDRQINFQQIAETLAMFEPPLMEDWKLVSLYEGDPIPEGKKSLSLRMRYRSADSTLKDEEADSVHNDYAAQVVRKLGCELR
ncbi:MAG: phenylalanine--tRNA ligase subunit beta [Candidatus Auribacterota bacterium]|jgi:phenylalanyl-tRNA synthetase beta chain|nr:phenylalanine--tRNA ligase subunit beta [Candidatus Auribacterota bacterium]